MGINSQAHNSVQPLHRNCYNAGNGCSLDGFMKPTPERILDAAENLFAEKGYAATSLGDVADRVGIRSPSLYNHFRNKEALYEAVLNRLIEKFYGPLEWLLQDKVDRQRILSWQQQLIELHARNPNLARLMQHAALSGGSHMNTLVEKLFKPMFDNNTNLVSAKPPALSQRPELLPWIVMAFNNIVMSYVTMAPMYQDMLGVDPFGEIGTRYQAESVRILTEAFWAYTDPETAAE
jgi:AcrR family transcriptional regulator